MKRTLSCCLAAALCSFLAVAAGAQTQIPTELEGWDDWVLQGEEFRRCPFFANFNPVDAGQFVCAWPGRLILELETSGGRFEQRWQVYTDSWVALPGDLGQWPRNVRSNGRPVAVVTRAGRPTTRLGPGNYLLSGEFRWRNRPEALPLPRQIGLLELSVDGQRIRRPQRQGDSLWLGQRRGGEERQQLEVQVYRLVSDEIPVRLTTQIRLQVAGDSREVPLGVALPKGFTPVSLKSSLPARLGPDGSLRVQVRAGSWQVAIVARGEGVADTLSIPQNSEVWPEVEIWSYQSNDRLRVSAVEGATPVDPAQVNVPPEWREFPGYRMSGESELRVVERSRGLSAADANQLTLSRQLWLDFDHRGFTAVDNIQGTMRQQWRLDMAIPFRLMSARTGEENLLVTDGAAEARTGVELRSPQVNLSTIARLQSYGGKVPATGWESRFAGVSGTLNLPPGHRLLAASGVDRAPRSWIRRWTLLDMFLVLMTSVAMGRLLGWPVGLMALLGLALTHQDSAGQTWLWLNLVVAFGLARVAPQGWLRKGVVGYRNASFAILVLVLLPFFFQQARLAIYPQLDGRGYVPSSSRGYASAARDVLTEAVASSEAPARQESLESLGRHASKVARLQQYAPGTLVQAGPGIPNWSYKSFAYSWSGPVDPSQTVRFWIVTPFWLSAWRILGIVLLAGWFTYLAGESFGFGERLRLSRWLRWPRSGGGAALMVFFAAIALPSGSAGATTPDVSILSELKNRLTQPPACSPTCAELLEARVEASTQRLDMTLTVSALADAAVAIPAAPGRWEPETILIDGQSNSLLYRDGQNQLWLPLRRGVRTVRLSGRLAAAESVQVVFPQTPRVIRTTSSGWEVSGVDGDRLLTGTLELIRRRSPKEDSGSLQASVQFPAFVVVRRHLRLDLNWTVTTTVERIAPDRGAFTMEIPLLEGESVLTQEVEADAARVLVAMPASEQAVRWQSALAHRNELRLTMPEGAARTEVWSFAVSPQWNVLFEGTPAILPQDPTAPYWIYEYHPRGGEALRVAVNRPQASKGESLAIDGVDLTVTAGKRSTTTTLNLNYRSTQGGRHSLRLPEAAEVLSVEVDGRSIPLRPEGGELPVALSPGEHALEVKWQTSGGAALRTSAPAVELRAPSSNLRTQLQMPKGRWVLFATGPGVGPAILFWAELIVFVVIALLLGRSGASPLRTYEWLLLGLGFSTFSWGVLLLFVTWLYLMRWRGSWQGDVSRGAFNLMQIMLGFLSIVALISLLTAIPFGLLASPDMSVRGPGSHGNSLTWFTDQSLSLLPQPTVISVSLWWYKTAMLLWALWLSFALLRWLPPAWRAFNANGLWRGNTPDSQPAQP